MVVTLGAALGEAAQELAKAENDEQRSAIATSAFRKSAHAAGIMGAFHVVMKYSAALGRMSVAVVNIGRAAAGISALSGAGATATAAAAVGTIKVVAVAMAGILIWELTKPETWNNFSYIFSSKYRVSSNSRFCRRISDFYGYFYYSI
jgi:hypothetical protein